MSELDAIINLACEHSQSNSAECSDDVIWDALSKFRDITKGLENKIAEKDKTIAEKDKAIAELERKNSLLTAERDHFQSLLKNQRPHALAANADDNSDEPHHNPPAYSRKRHIAIDQETVKLLKNSRNHAVVCDKALQYWQELVNHELITPNLMPSVRCGVTTAARIVCRLQTSVDANIKWSFFERRWKIGHLQSNLNRSSYKDEKYYPIVNTIFGLAADAQFISKRNKAD